MERRITRRQALGAAGSAGAALLVSRGALTALGELVAAAPAAAATMRGRGRGHAHDDRGPVLDRRDAAPLRRAREHRVCVGLGGCRAGRRAPHAQDQRARRRKRRARSTAPTSTSGTRTPYGLYSDEGGQQGGGNTSGQNYLRGYQVTGVDAGALAAPVDGQVNFKTIWPGWYSGRAIHIHVRVRTYDGSAVATNYTTQIFFSDADNDAVMSGAAPYNTRSPKTDPTTDETDNILASSSARATNVVPVSGSIADGFAAAFTIGLSGVASNVTADTQALTASIVSAKVTKASDGNRTVVVSVKTGGTATAHASLVRNGKTLAKATGQLTTGTHSLRMALGKGVRRGGRDRQARARRLLERHPDPHEEGDRSGVGAPLHWSTVFDALSDRLGSALGDLRKQAAGSTRRRSRARCARSGSRCSRPTSTSRSSATSSSRVRERALGEEVLKSLTPGQQVVKIVHEELTDLLGSDTAELELGRSLGHPARGPPGLGQDDGRRQARPAAARSRAASPGSSPPTSSGPAAIDQLEQLGAQIGVPGLSHRHAATPSRRRARASSAPATAGSTR